MKDILNKIFGVTWIFQADTIYKRTNRLLTVLLVVGVVTLTILILIGKYFMI